MSKVYTIKDKKMKSMIDNMMYNWNHMYFSYNNNIKYIIFESIHYAINLDTVSSFMVFNDFDFIFLSMYW